MTKTTITVSHPSAANIAIRGEGQLGGWNQEVQPTSIEGNVARFVFELPPDASVDFKPVISGQDIWKHGANERVTAGQSVELFPTFQSGKGRVETLFLDFYSYKLQNHRDILMYLPPGYDENPGKKYPVIYMMDGQMVFESRGSETGNTWKAEQAMDALLANNLIEPAIIIAVPHMGRERIAEYSPTPDPGHDGGKADLFREFLVRELKPQVDAKLRTLGDAENTYLIGSSMGGLVCAYVALKEPGFAKNVAALSPAAWWNDDWLAKEIREGRLDPHALNKVYVDYGDHANDGGRGTEVLKDSLRAQGLRENQLKTRTEPGALHSEWAWAQRLPDVMMWLLNSR